MNEETIDISLTESEFITLMLTMLHGHGYFLERISNQEDVSFYTDQVFRTNEIMDKLTPLLPTQVEALLSRQKRINEAKFTLNGMDDNE